MSLENVDNTRLIFLELELVKSGQLHFYLLRKLFHCIKVIQFYVRSQVNYSDRVVEAGVHRQ